MSFSSNKENFIQNLVDKARGKKMDSNSSNLEMPHKTMEGNEDDCPYLKSKEVKQNKQYEERGQPLSDLDVNSTLDNTASSHSLIPSSHSLIPKGHLDVKTGYSEKDKEKCPYFKIISSATDAQPNEAIEVQENDKQSILSSSSEDEDGIPKRPKGGCPFLPSERKKNPGLIHTDERFNTFYLSRYACYLEQDNMMTLKRDFSKIIHSKPSKNRRVFESYPIYLKHTLFHEDEMIKQIRKKEIVERFLAYDKFRERGNRLFNKKKYIDALYLYERSLSCYKWLELKDSDEEEKKQKKEKRKNEGFKMHTYQNNSDTHNIFEEQKTSTITQRSVFKKEVEPIQIKKEEDDNDVKPFIKQKPQKAKKQFKEDAFEEDEENNNQNKSDEEQEDDNEEDIQKYKKNDGTSLNQLNELIQSRQQDILEQERLRQMMLSKVRKDKQKQQQDQDNAQNSHDSRNCSDNDDNDNKVSDKDEEESEDDDQQLERIAKAKELEVPDDAKSLSVEGFDDGSDRNFSSEEEEIDIEKIQEENKNPDETVIIMDEEEKKKMIAEEKFLRQNEKEDKEFRKKYRLFITNFNDENILLRDGEDLTDSNDIDLRFSMLVGAYLSIGTCYMMLGHFKEAMTAFKDARNLHKKGSIPLLKMAQCRLYNKASTYLELLEAKEWLDLSVEYKQTEKVFNSGAASLVVMNILNHVAFYEDVGQRLSARIESQKEVEQERLGEMFERVVELNEIEQDMIERGITPADSEANSIQVQEKEIEEELALIIEGKYYTLLETQMYAENYQKMEKTNKELQTYYETFTVVEYYKNLDFQNYENHPLMKQLALELNVDMLRAKNQLRFQKLKIENMKDAFNSVEHNFAIYKWALDEYMEKKKQAAEKRKSSEKVEPKSAKDKVSSFISTLFGKQSLIQFVFIFIICYTIVIFLRSSMYFPETLNLNLIPK